MAGRMCAGALAAAAAAAGMVWLGGSPAAAQEWEPEEPITIVVGFSAGGGTDIIARQLAASAQEHFPVPLVILNKPGAAGTLAAQEVAAAEPDGYTLLVGGGSESTSVGAFKELPYDTRTDFTPILRVTSNPQMLVVGADSDFQTLEDLVEAAEAGEGAVSYGSSGVGSLVHATSEVFADEAGLEMKHIPYQGGGPALQALIAGQIDFMFSALDEAQGHMEAGTVRALAVARPERIEGYPDIPTLTEAGYDVTGDNMKGLLAPAGLPDEIYTYLHDNFRKALDGEVWTSFTEEAKFQTEYLGGPAFQQAMTDLLNKISEAVDQ